MLGEVTHLQTILEDLTNLTAEPNKLPPASEQVPSSSSDISSSATLRPNISFLPGQEGSYSIYFLNFLNPTEQVL